MTPRFCAGLRRRAAAIGAQRHDRRGRWDARAGSGDDIMAASFRFLLSALAVSLITALAAGAVAWPASWPPVSALITGS
jgi:hypothetical protein